jgi:hypothetical protein
VQRLPRYELLLRELRKLTPSDHADSEQLDLSLEFMKDCNEQINMAIGAAKRRARSRILDKLLSSRPSYAACKMPPLLPPKRCCIDHWFGLVHVTAQTYVSAAVGPEIMRLGKKKEKKLKNFDCVTRKLLVLSDRLIFIGKESRKDWRVTAVFPLRSVWLNAEEDYPCLFVTCDDGGCDHEWRVPDGVYKLSIECVGNDDHDFEVPQLENSAPAGLWPQLLHALSQWVSKKDRTGEFDDAYLEDLEARRASAKFIQKLMMWKDFSFDTNIRALPVEPVEFSIYERPQIARPASAVFSGDVDFSKVRRTEFRPRLPWLLLHHYKTRVSQHACQLNHELCYLTLCQDDFSGSAYDLLPEVASRETAAAAAASLRRPNDLMPVRQLVPALCQSRLACNLLCRIC